MVLNITAVDQSASTYLTVFPAGSPRPSASNLNPTPGFIQPNLVIAKVGAGGEVSIYNDVGSLHLIADVQGWFPSGAGAAYQPLDPARLLETRLGGSTIDGQSNGVGQLGPGETVTLMVAGRGGVPASGAASVVVNITAVNQTQHSFLTAFASGTVRPNTSNLNPRPGLTATNLAVVSVGVDGKISIFNSVGSVDVIVDVMGWFSTGLGYPLVEPARLLDTRPGSSTIDGVAVGGGRVFAGQTLDLQVAGRGGVPPTGVSAVVVNVTAVDPTSGTYLTVFPDGAARPLASNLNPSVGQTVPNLVIAKVGTNGQISIYNDSGTVHLLVDVFGWLPDDTVVTDDTPNLTEDDPATLIDVLANDVDNDGGPMSIASASQPANGTVILTGGVPGAFTALTYEPDANYCNTPPGSALDTFTYTLNGGFTGDVSVIVNCVDDPLTAVDDSASTTEDAIEVVLVRANDIDDDPFLVTIVGAPDNGGSVSITNAGADVTFDPGSDFQDLDTGEQRVTTFTYTIDNTIETDTATVTVTVSGINDAPDAIDDNVTTNEDTSAVFDVLANDTDVDLESRSVTAVGAPDNGGSVSITNAGADVTFDPGSDFQDLDTAEQRVTTFTYTISDGTATDVATVTITVTGVNDAPDAVDDTSTTDQNTSIVINVLSNDTDVEIDFLAVTLVGSPSNGGSVTVTNGGADVTFDPGTDFQDSVPSEQTTFTYTVSDGTDTDTATVTVTVTGLNDPPVNNVPTSVQALPGSGTDWTATVSGASITDPDSFAQDIQVTLVVAAGDITINTGVAGGVVAGQVTGNGTDTIVIIAARDAINNTLADAVGIGYTVDPQPGPSTTLTVTTDDLGNTGPGGALTDTDVIPINFNLTPIADSGSESTDEGTPILITLTASDADNDNLTFLVVDPDNGSLDTTTPSADCSALNTCFAQVTYTPDPDYNGLDDFTFTVNDGSSTSDPGTVSITVSAVNDAPVNALPAAQTTAEDSNEVLSTANGSAISISDVDLGANPIQVTLTITNGTITQPSTAGLSFSVGDGTTDTTMTFTGTLTAVNTVLDGPTYIPTPNFNGAATLTVVANDQGSTGSGGAQSDTDLLTINVTAVNDPPANTVPGAQSVDEDTNLTFNVTNGNLISIADIDAGAGSVKVTVSAVNGTITPSSGSGATITGSATASAEITGTVTQVNAALNNLVYRGTAHYNVTRGSETITVFTTDQGNTGTGGPLTDSDTIGVTVNAVNDAPIATTQSFDVITNMQRTITIALSGAGGPTDPDTGDASYTAVFTLSSVTLPGSGCTGCVLTNINLGAGTFDFEPPAGQTGAFTVDYTVTDNGNPAPGVISATGKLTMNVAGNVIWFVNPSAAVNGTGTLAHPFQALSGTAGVNNDVDDVDAASHRVFVYSGGTAAGALTLNNGEWVIGQAANPGVGFDSFFSLGTIPTGTLARPALNTGTTTLSGTITLATNAKIQGPTISTGGSTALAGSGAITGVDVTQTTLTTTTGTALSLNDVAGTITLTDLDKNGTGTGISLTTVGATVTVPATATIANTNTAAVDIDGGTGAFSYAGTITNSTGRTVEVTNRNAGSPGLVQFTGLVTGSGGTGVNLDNNDNGAISFSGGLALSTGANAAFNAINGGTVSVTGSTNTLTTTSGTALNVVSTTIGASDLTFRSISAGTGAGTPANGIVLNTTGSLGELIVTGDGGTCTAANTAGCSGGEIRNTVGGDDAGVSPVGTGIVLRDTKAPSFTRMWVHDNSNYAIRGNTVAGFTLANSVINGVNGTNAASPFRDASVAFDDLTGSASVASSAISGGYADNFRVLNAAGSLDRITFSGVTIGDNNAANGNDAVLLESSGSATLKVTVTGSTFTGAAGDLLQFSHGGAGTGDLVLTGNNFSNNHPGIATGGGGLTLSNEGTSGATTMNIDNNDFRDAVGPGVLIVKSTGNSTQVGTFNNNRIGVAATPNSGSAEGSALKLQTVGGGTQTWAVTNNTIYGYNNYGIEVLAGGSASAQSGNVNTTITGNLIAQPGNTLGTQAISKNGIHLNIGTVTGDTYAACAAIGGAGALANSISTAGLDGVPATGAGDNDFRLRQRQSTTIRLPGYGGAATDTSAVNLYIASQNAGNGAAVGISSVNSPPGGGFTGGASPCA